MDTNLLCSCCILMFTDSGGVDLCVCLCVLQGRTVVVGIYLGGATIELVCTSGIYLCTSVQAARSAYKGFLVRPFPVSRLLAMSGRECTAA